MRRVTERRTAQRYPLTADLAGVLESASPEYAPRRDPGAAPWSGLGAALRRAASAVAGRRLVRRADAGAPAHTRSA